MFNLEKLRELLSKIVWKIEKSSDELRCFCDVDDGHMGENDGNMGILALVVQYQSIQDDRELMSAL